MANAYVADITPPERRAQSFGMMGAAFGLGFILGPAIGGLLGEMGPRVPFFVAAAISGLNVVYGFFVLPESLAREHRRAFDWRRINPLVAVMALRRYPVVASMVVIVVLHQLAFQVLPSVWTFFTMYRFDWSTAEVGYSLAFSGTMMIIVQAFLVRRIVPAIGEHRAAMIGLAFTGIGYYVYAFAPFGWVLYVGLVLAALSGLVMPALNALMSREVGPQSQGELQGAVGSVTSLTMIVGPILMTNLFGYSTRADAVLQFAGSPFLLSGVLTTIALLLLLRAVAVRAPVARASAQVGKVGDP
jgi:DHA1 family tetracycline resistance protein-like MFS transporter